MNTASRIILARQLLHCAKMVLDAGQFKENKSMNDIDRIALKIAREYIASPFRNNNIPMKQSNMQNENYQKYEFDCNDPIVRDAVIEELKKISQQQSVIKPQVQLKINQQIKKCRNRRKLKIWKTILCFLQIFQYCSQCKKLLTQ